jgi:ferredoxin
MTYRTDVHRVRLANRDVPDLEVRADETILGAADRAGVPLPSGCRDGHCISCAARLLEGHVDQSAGEALTRAEREEGYVLLCVARPRSDCVLRVGAEVQKGLFRNPFLEG